MPAVAPIRAGSTIAVPPNFAIKSPVLRLTPKAAGFTQTLAVQAIDSMLKFATIAAGPTSIFPSNSAVRNPALKLLPTLPGIVYAPGPHAIDAIRASARIAHISGAVSP
jgi:hypothetical protein